MKAILTFGILILYLILPISVSAQATAYANIYACVVEPVSIISTNKTDFPKVSVNDIYPDSTGSASSNQSTLNDQGQNKSIILTSFCISKVHQTFDIMLPKESMMVGSHGSHPMTVSDF